MPEKVQFVWRTLFLCLQNDITDFQWGLLTVDNCNYNCKNNVYKILNVTVLLVTVHLILTLS